ncbi:MAG: hypothetical protein KatS3mg068_2011 [Candidatus Sericytochromatia bacterium]|nr:MAG: hypothetical protein KatS3mg068_2011 [Candidatus Sericytochromatia bacterium]
MKKILISLSVISSITLLSGLAFAKGDPKAGKKVYDQNCAMCHGPKGAGDGAAAAALNPKPRNFTEGKFKYGSKDEDLAKLIKNGKGPMPPWGSVLKPADIDNVIAYIRTLKKK